MTGKAIAKATRGLKRGRTAGAARPAGARGAGDVEYRTADGFGLCRASELPTLDLRTLLAVREPSIYKGQRNMPGWHWCRTTQSLLLYESVNEQTVLSLLDYERDVVEIVPQPLRLWFSKLNHHVPDYLVELRNGERRLLDVTTERRLEKPETQKQFEQTRKACANLGWDYVVVRDTDLDPQFVVNMRFLATFRRATPDAAEFGSRLIRACKQPRPLRELAAEIGASQRIKPVLFNLIWHSQLFVDLWAPLELESVATSSWEAMVALREEPGPVLLPTQIVWLGDSSQTRAGH